MLVEISCTINGPASLMALHEAIIEKVENHNSKSDLKIDPRQIEGNLPPFYTEFLGSTEIFEYISHVLIPEVDCDCQCPVETPVFSDVNAESKSPTINTGLTVEYCCQNGYQFVSESGFLYTNSKNGRCITLACDDEHENFNDVYFWQEENMIKSRRSDFVKLNTGKIWRDSRTSRNNNGKFSVLA